MCRGRDHPNRGATTAFGRLAPLQQLDEPLLPSLFSSWAPTRCGRDSSDQHGVTSLRHTHCAEPFCAEVAESVKRCGWLCGSTRETKIRKYLMLVETTWERPRSWKPAVEARLLGDGHRLGTSVTRLWDNSQDEHLEKGLREPPRTVNSSTLLDSKTERLPSPFWHLESLLHTWS
jgi:hypothetical protein